jgi:hypothetical protein
MSASAVRGCRSMGPAAMKFRRVAIGSGALSSIELAGGAMTKVFILHDSCFVESEYSHSLTIREGERAKNVTHIGASDR